MKTTVRLSGVLERNPYPLSPKVCEARMLPLKEESDFIAISALPVNTCPVLLNHTEHYRLLEELLQIIEQSSLSIDIILLRMQMPAGGRMPKAFLTDSVLMLHDVVGEESILLREGKSYIVIEDSLPRHPFESGSNQLEVRISTAESSQLLVEALAKQLIECGFANIKMYTMDGTT
ncbi:hypothetical protein MO867_10400 [Microbulbifer sp. OS29]|uniref:Uncharacterized protein n=1 Tax=Microbulbifer okhotskensis TaxID=2926617 RepID=A0A9X2EN52_9GAMM|nr:hypothetical protein [Microbulbifer okhotskensis]MCO1334749.1 hypothetical protein [Microbulbifer okhotskensis]